MPNYHGDIPLGQRHALHQWEYADATARNAATGFVAGDLRKVALQLSDNTYWQLTATTPTWVAVGGGGGGGAPSGAAGGDLTGTYPNPTVPGLATKEPSLGNPATSGYVLSSTAAGARSWIAPGSGGGLTNPMTTAQDLIVGGAAGAPARLGVGGANQVLTVVNGVLTWATPAAGGAATKGLALQPLAPAGANDDEFEDLSGQSGPVNGLVAAWSKHNLATPSWLALSDQQGPSCLSFSLPAAQAADQILLRPAPSGDFAITAVFEPLSFSDRQMWALFIVDASGNGISMIWDMADNPGLRTVAAWAQTTPINLITSYPQNQRGSQVLLLRKTGTSYYGNIIGTGRRRVPPDNVTMTPPAFTPAYIGFGRIFGTGTATVLLDALRVY